MYVGRPAYFRESPTDTNSTKKVSCDVHATIRCAKTEAKTKAAEEIV